jgi:hypothetical protein
MFSTDLVLKCECCGLPFARLVNGCIVVESRHHGEKHQNAIAVDELVKLRQGGAPDGCGVQAEAALNKSG